MELDLGGPIQSAQRGQHPPERGLGLAEAGGEQPQDRVCRQPDDQLPEQEHAGGIGPLQIVHKHDQRGALGSLLDHRARVVDDAQAAVKDRPLRRRRQPQTAADGVQGFTRLLAVAAGAGHLEAGDRRHIDGVMNEAGLAAARGSLDHDHASLASRCRFYPLGQRQPFLGTAA